MEEPVPQGEPVHEVEPSGGPLEPVEAVGPVGGAQSLLLRPDDYFRRMAREGGFAAPVKRILVWSLAGAVISLLYELAGLGPYGEGGVPAGLLFLILGPAVSLVSAFVGAACLHLLARLIGGQSAYEASFRIVASMAVLSPLAALIGPVPYGFIPFQLYGLVLTVVAVGHVHGAPRGRAWVVFGLLTASLIAWSLLAPRLRGPGAPAPAEEPMDEGALEEEREHEEGEAEQVGEGAEEASESGEAAEPEEAGDEPSSEKQLRSVEEMIQRERALRQAQGDRK